MVTILVLLGVAFVFFSIYFIFKQMQFVLVAVDLYKQMINRQDTMIKLLIDIKKRSQGTVDVQSTAEDEEILPTGYVRMHEESGTAYCCGCQKIVPAKGMLYSRSIDTYYHPECLPKQ
jgi:hypothetical protein